MGTKTDDLIVVSRDGVNYKATGTQLFDFDGSATFGGSISGNGPVGYKGNEVRVFNTYNSSPGSDNGGIHLSYNDNASKDSIITAGSNNSSAPRLDFALVLQGEEPKDNIKASIAYDGKFSAIGYRIDLLTKIESL